MFDTLPEHHQRKIARIANRLNSYTGSVVLRKQGVSVFLVVAANDVLLLRQAYYGPMNRSSQRKLRERLFETKDAVDMDDELSDTLSQRDNGDADHPFLCFYFGKGGREKYAVLKAENLARMEYILYVGQSAFREYLHRKLAR